MFTRLNSVNNQIINTMVVKKITMSNKKDLITMIIKKIITTININISKRQKLRESDG